MRHLVEAEFACDGSFMAEGKPPSRSIGCHPPRQTDPRASGARTKRRVLIVDDVEDNRYLYATYFDHIGYHAEEAADGEEALAMLQATPFDVVIMDLSMPKLDGWETTRRIKSDPHIRQVLVVVVTGNTTEANISSAYAAGADEVRSKPCVPHELLALVQRRLDEPRVAAAK